MTDKNDKITIDGTEYNKSEISEDCMAEIQSLAFTNELIQRLGMEIAVATTAANGYKSAIIKQLPKKTAKH